MWVCKKVTLNEMIQRDWKWNDIKNLLEKYWMNQRMEQIAKENYDHFFPFFGALIKS